MSTFGLPVVTLPKFGTMVKKKVVADALEKAADRIADGARQWGEEHRVTGAYAAGVEVEMTTSRDGRPVAKVKATAPHSAAVEYGNARVDAQAPMRNAAEGAGYRLGKAQ